MNILPYGLPTLFILITLWIIVERSYQYQHNTRWHTGTGKVKSMPPPSTVGEVNPKWYRAYDKKKNIRL